MFCHSVRQFQSARAQEEQLLSTFSSVGFPKETRDDFPDYFETVDSRTTKNSSDKVRAVLRAVSIGLVCGCVGTAAATAAAPT